jgi:uncharacterized Zn finger protein
MKTIRTWWGQRFIAALEQFTDSARLARGRGYANPTRIKTWKLVGHEVQATIRGNVNPYFGVYKEPSYDTRIALQRIPEEDWKEVIRQLGSQAAFVSRLLLHEMPDHIEEPFQAMDLNLLPRRAKDLRTQCSCPDYANPCKHVAGLCYFLAGKLDHDPFLLFELRGLARETLLQQLRETPLGQALVKALQQEEVPFEPVGSYFTRPLPQALSSPIDPQTFWQGRKRLPDTLEPSTPTSIPALLVKKGGDYPEFWNQEHSFITTLEAAYEAIRKSGKDW